MKKIILILLVPIISFSQEIKGKITGKNKEPISYVNVILKNDSNKVVTTYTTIENGEFIFQNIEKGNYKIETYFLGYKKFTKEITLINKANLEIELEEDTEQLDEIELSAQAPLVESVGDKLVVNVSGSNFAKGRMTDELLNYTPFLSVSEGGLQLLNSTPIVLINDQRVYMSGGELIIYLQSIPAEDIKSIEIYTNPPARFDADGSGVVNIYINKQALLGVKGYINQRGRVYTQDNLWSSTTFGQVSYKDEKWYFSTYLNYSNTKSPYRLKDEVLFLDKGNEFNNSSKQINRGESKTVRFNVSRDINKNHSTFLNYQYNNNTGDNTTENKNKILDNKKQTTDVIDGNISSNTGSDVHIAGLNYTWKIDDKGQKLVVMGDYYNRNNIREDDIENIYTSKIDSTNNLYLNIPLNSKIASGQLDYNKPLFGGILSAGGKYASSKVDSRTDYYKVNNGNRETDPTNSIEFDYTENISALYTSYGIRNLKIGLRYEYTDAKYRDFKNDKGKVDKSYGGFFPSVSYTQPLFEKRDAITLSYNRRIQRPSYRTFGEFNYINENQQLIGNSEIKPAFLNKIQLMYNLMKKYIIIGEFIYTPNRREQLIFQKNNKVIIQRRNLENYYQGVMAININQKIFNWWNTRLAPVIGYIKIYSQFKDIGTINGDAIIFDLRLNNNFNINGWNIEITNFYTPKWKYIYITKHKRYSTNLSVRKSILRNKLNFAIYINDVFNHYNNRITSNLGNIILTAPLQRQGRFIRLSLRYNFHYGKKKVRDKRIRRSIEDEINRSN